MRAFVTFLSMFTLLFFLAPVLCLGIGPAGTEPAHGQTGEILLPQTVSCHGEQIATADILVGMLATLEVRGYHTEALKAAAVTVTTQLAEAYANTGTADGIVFKTPKQAKEAWGDYWFSQYWPQMQQAVRDTWGQVLLADGAIFTEGQVFPLSWGQTAAGVECPYDFTSNNYKTVINISLDDFTEVFPNGPASLTVKKAQSGRVETVTSGNTELTGTQMAERFGLPSPAFSVTVEETGVRFTCLGQGNGEGMSLYGANEMAKRGSDYKEILTLFYPKATLSH